VKAKLTQDLIFRTACPDGADILEVFDTEQRGLVLRIYAGGSKVFWCRYSDGGRKVKYRLGDAVAGITLKAARDAVQKTMGELAQGRDPAGERKAKAAEDKRKADEQAFTLETLIDRWAALHLKDARASYRDEAPRALKIAFAGELGSAASDLTDKTVIRTKGALAEAGKDALASAVLRYGHAAFAWAVSERLIDRNPFAGIKKPKVESRDRVLEDSELRAIWHATQGPGSFNAIVRFLILTGQRREEVAGLRWSELNNDRSVWTIPAERAKNGVAHIVPLPSPALQIVEAAWKLRRRAKEGAPPPKGAEFVFPGEQGVYQGFGHSKVRLDAAIQAAREKAAAGKVDHIPNWRLHDLRRTVATNMQALGVRLEVTEAVLNHVSGSRAGIAGVYQRHDWAREKREGLSAWGERVTAIVEGRETADNVIPMRA
jgi:integrase